MVEERSLSICSKSGSEISDEDPSCVSVATSDPSDDESNHNNQVVLSDRISNERHSFGNIAVTNSNDVHFGDKNIYQGPVTIKQFLYANSPASIENTIDENSDNKLAIKDISYVITNDNGVPGIIECKNNPGLVVESEGVDLKNIDDNEKLKDQHLDTSKSYKWFKKISKQRIFFALSLAAVLVVSLTTLLSVILTKHHPTSTNSVLQAGWSKPETSAPAEYPVDINKTRFVKRSVWGAETVEDELTLLKMPIPYVIISHTATETCSTIQACISDVKQVQFFHKHSRNWSDIGYNFLVGGDGNAYEGRGWKAQGAHTYGYNSMSIGLSFIGTFNNIMPTASQIERAKELIEEGVNLRYLDKNYKLFAARQLQTTQSPGLLLYQDLKKWPHWSKAPTEIPN